MSAPRYERYKDSGVEGIGEIPGHWDVVAVRLLFELGRGRVISHEEIINNSGEYPVYSSQTEHFGVMGRIATYDFEGDYLTWTTDGANAGTVFRRRGRFNCTNVCGTLKAKRKETVLDYSVHAISISTAAYVRLDINPKLMNNVMAGIRIPVPPAAEQQVIATFLDRESGKIDALIAEQRRLIDLLREKRQAVISHAVTKGLDPAAPMKDSGVEWLGNIPSHWHLRHLKRMALIVTDGAHTSPETEDGVVPFVSTKDIGRDCINFDGSLMTSRSNYLDLARANCQPAVGDVLYSKDGTIGRTVVIREQREFVVGSSLIIIRPDGRRLNPAFLNYLCQSTAVRQQVDLFVKGAGLPRLSVQNILKVIGTCPPIPEQISISTFLDRETATIDALVAEAESAIALLQERRSALISAAVTGKIDVRGLGEQSAQQEAA